MSHARPSKITSLRAAVTEGHVVHGPPWRWGQSSPQRSCAHLSFCISEVRNKILQSSSLRRHRRGVFGSATILPRALWWLCCRCQRGQHAETRLITMVRNDPTRLPCQIVGVLSRWSFHGLLNVPSVFCPFLSLLRTRIFDYRHFVFLQKSFGTKNLPITILSST